MAIIVTVLLLADVDDIGKKGELVQLSLDQYLDRIEPNRVGMAGGRETLETLALEVLPPLKHHRRDTKVIGRIPDIVRKLFLNLCNVWTMTAFRTESFQRSTFVYALARPTDGLRDSFHLEREVLVVFEGNQSNIRKSMDFANKVRERNGDTLDPWVVILVSQDEDIEMKIDRYVQKSDEAHQIIPMTYSFLESASSSEQLAKLETHFSKRDLYSFSTPVQHNFHFFGRDQFLRDLHAMHDKGQNTGLFGLRKTGKTSLLFALQRQLDARHEPYIHLECSNTDIQNRRWNELLAYIVSLAAEKFGVPLSKLHAESEYTERDASGCFEHDLRTIQRKLGRQKRILITMDEIEFITFDISRALHWASGGDFLSFWQAVRAVFQRTRDLFSVVVAGVNPHCVECPTVGGIDNPIYRFIIPYYLPMFELSDVRSMVTDIGRHMGLHYEDETIKSLYEYYGGHPFLIRSACSEIHQSIHDSRPYLVTSSKYKGMKPRVVRKLQPNIDHILTVLLQHYPAEYEMLQYLADGRQDAFLSVVEVSNSIVEHLEGYGVILVNDEAGEYTFRIKAVQEYLHDKTVLRLLKTQPDASRGELLPILLRRASVSLRRTVKQILKANYGQDEYGRNEGKQRLLSHMSPNRQTRLGRIDLDVLLTGDGTEITLEDIQTVILSHWPDFKQIFRRDPEFFKHSMRAVFAYMDAVRALPPDRTETSNAETVPQSTEQAALAALEWIIRQTESYLS